MPLSLGNFYKLSGNFSKEPLSKLHVHCHINCVLITNCTLNPNGSHSRQVSVCELRSDPHSTWNHSGNPQTRSQPTCLVLVLAGCPGVHQTKGRSGPHPAAVHLSYLTDWNWFTFTFIISTTTHD